MAKIEITKTELVWPGKYNEDGTLKQVPRVSLPFQVIETINESRATREGKKRGVQGTLFDVYEGNEGDTFEEGWRNKLIWGDNLLVMGSLLEKFAGKIDLIYIDPPFATGADFSFTTEIGEQGLEVDKEQSLIEERAYRDTWGQGHSSYLDMLFQRLRQLRDLLSERGTIYVHLDDLMVSHVKCVMDEVFGLASFINQIVWRRTGSNTSPRRYGRNYDSLLVYGKADSWIWNNPRGEYDPDYIASHYKSADPDGRKYQLVSMTGAGETKNDYEWKGIRAPRGRHWAYTKEKMLELAGTGRLVESTSGGPPRVKYYLDKQAGPPLQALWTDIKVINSQAEERVNYATQKPEALLERILKASSNDVSLVADFFCGSGTTLAVAEKLGRRWIGCDLGRWAIHVTRKRLLGIENCKPFEVLNLGKYERQYWQGVTFGEKKDKPITEQALYEYLAFILKLYGAQPVAGLVHLHGKKGKAMIHIGAVDAPVTIGEIDAAVDECVALKQKELHVLGWEWEMGLYDLMVEAAKKKGVKLLLLQIPREVMEEQAAAKGDVSFFELAYLEAEIKQPKELTAQR